MKRSLDDGNAWAWLALLLGTGAVVVALGGAAAGGLAPGTRWSALLDWQPARIPAEAWRLWTCAWIHWSAAHLVVNLVGAAVVGAVGWRARMPAWAALAWFLAWPLTHLLMALPESTQLAHTLQHYGGLSGVLHAGVVVLGLTLARTRLHDPMALPGPDTWFGATQASMIEPSRITEGPWAVTNLEDAPASPHTLLPVSTLDAPPQPLARLSRAQAVRHRWIGVALVGGTMAKVLLEAPWNQALRPNALLGIDVAPIAHACGIAAGVIAWAIVAMAAMAWRQPGPAFD